MKPPSGPKKQTQNKANFFKGQNRLPKNPATPFPSLGKKIIDMSLLLWNNEPPYEGSNEKIIGSGCI